MDNSTVMYIAVFAAVVAVIALIMIWQVVHLSISPQHRHRPQLPREQLQLLKQLPKLLTMVQS